MNTYSDELVRWLAGGERGTSSNAIVEKITGLPALSARNPSYPATPSDPGDLRRCRLLLEAVPMLAERFHEMAEVSERWKKMVERWDELCALHDQEAPEWRAGVGRAPRTYAMMAAIRNTK